jgi:hypothetical protein
MSAREIVERLLRAGREGDADTFAGLMAPDGFIAWPYRPPGAPARVEGRAAIRRHLAEVNEFVRFAEHRDMVVHETTDPAVVIVEYEAHGTVVPTGAPLRQSVIAVFHVRGGAVVSCRDYINPLALAEALGQPPCSCGAPTV